MDSRSIFRRLSLDAEFQHAIVRCSWAAANAVVRFPLRELPQSLFVDFQLRRHRSAGSCCADEGSMMNLQCHDAHDWRRQEFDLIVKRKGSFEIAADHDFASDEAADQ